MIDKYVDFARKCGSRTQYRHALEVLLPSSIIYNYLEGRILRPAYTYTNIADIIEDEEKEIINKEIGQRRTRLGAKIDQVTSEVKREVAEKSQLEDLYQCIIEWTDDDEARRHYEEKLLQRAYDTLAVLPAHDKAGKRGQVQALAKGLVILKHPFALAWKTVLEWEDVEAISQLDVGLLREFIEFFPQDGLSKVLQGYLESEISPFPKPTPTDKSGGDVEESPEYTTEERLLQMTEGLEDSATSVLSNRIMGEYYLYLEEYGSAIEVIRKAQAHLLLQKRLAGLSFSDITDALDIILASALVQYQTPRHHPEARELFDGILNRKPTNASALVGVGFILEEEEEYQDAIDFLTRALERTPDVKIWAETAWCKSLVGDLNAALSELEACLSCMKGSDPQSKVLRARTLYRVGMCIWNQDDSRSARKDRNGAYAHFLASIQADMNFAPSYTRLGVYYADYAKDKKRARKCFQKAFELSSSEVEAAERLARSFAKSGEWDLVEVVAQRVVESGKIRPPPGSRKRGHSWPFVALGVVQLNNQEYAKSIVSFQSALRSSPEDYHSWVGLGESYHNSGRYIAATKAFEQAQKLKDDPEAADNDEEWFSVYMLANVKRELGNYDEASVRYKQVLTTRPHEFGVALALLQNLVEAAWRNVELGFFGRAVENAGKAMEVAEDIMTKRNDAINLWKAIGDACSIYSWIENGDAKAPIEMLRLLLENGVNNNSYDTLANVDEIDEHSLEVLSPREGPTSSSRLCVLAAILAHKRAIALSTNDHHARAVAWYNLGWAEYRGYLCGIDQVAPSSGKGSIKYLKACVQCFKKAIELEGGNAEFWNALGVVTSEMNPKVSQHSFVRSLYLNEKSARVWTNLGALYLIYNDLQLAHEAFTRSQSTDPDYSRAWLGQGLLAQSLGELDEARNLFTHAFEIADSSSVLTKRQYTLSTFDHLSKVGTATQKSVNLVQPLLALHQLRRQVSADVSSQHLLALFAEKVGDPDMAVAELTTICSKLEADYEESEAPLTLARFAQTKSDLARAHLAKGEYSTAAEHAETALDLSSDEGMEISAHERIRLSGHLTAGLAYLYTGSMDQAIGMFRSALEETDSDPDIICLLAQVLWAKGGEQERNVARDQLFNCIERSPGHFGAITLLGVIAVLEEDRDTLEAVTADLQNLQTRQDLNTEQQLEIAQLLRAAAKANSGGQSEMSQARAAVMLAPSQPHGWLELASLTDQPYPADMALLTARRAVPPVGPLDAEALCKAYAGTGAVGDSQRAVMTAPWAASGWHSLRESSANR